MSVLTVCDRVFLVCIAVPSTACVRYNFYRKRQHAFFHLLVIWNQNSLYTCVFKKCYITIKKWKHNCLWTYRGGGRIIMNCFQCSIIWFSDVSDYNNTAFMNKHFSLLYYLDNADRQNSSAWDFCFLPVFALWDAQETLHHVVFRWHDCKSGERVDIKRSAIDFEQEPHCGYSRAGDIPMNPRALLFA